MAALVGVCLKYIPKPMTADFCATNYTTDTFDSLVYHMSVQALYNRTKKKT